MGAAFQCTAFSPSFIAAACSRSSCEAASEAPGKGCTYRRRLRDRRGLAALGDIQNGHGTEGKLAALLERRELVALAEARVLKLLAEPATRAAGRSARAARFTEQLERCDADTAQGGKRTSPPTCMVRRHPSARQKSKSKYCSFSVGAIFSGMWARGSAANRRPRRSFRQGLTVDDF